MNKCNICGGDCGQCGSPVQASYVWKGGRWQRAQFDRVKRVAGIGAVISALLLALIAGWNSAVPEHPCVTLAYKFQVSGICAR